jgi:hypothetical protein
MLLRLMGSISGTGFAEDDRLVGHAGDAIAGQEIGGGDADKYLGPDRTSRRAPVRLSILVLATSQSILPPRCIRNMRSETLRTVKPSNRCGHRYGVGDVAGVASNVDHQHCRVGLGHVERGDGSPASATTTDSPAIAVGSVGDSTGTVMEYAGLGAAVGWSFFCVTSVTGELATAAG